VDDNGQVKLPIEYSQRVYDARIAAEVVPVLVELEVAVPHLSPAWW
jgi:hypothetical protein